MSTMSPLRQRMIEDLTVRNLSPATQRSYLHAVAKFSRHFGRSPDRLGLEEVRAFQVHLVAAGISWPALNQTVCALRFFYGVTLGRGEIPERIPTPASRASRVVWVVYVKPPFGGPEQVLAYLGRYTHRVAIANSRLVGISADAVAFRWTDYRHHGNPKVMTLGADEFIRRFLLHSLPDGFHRIRHYGFLANRHRAEKLALANAAWNATGVRVRNLPITADKFLS